MTLGKNLKASETHTEIGNDDFIQGSVEYDQPAEGQEEEHHEMQLLCVFDAGGEEYAIPMDYVKEVVKMPSITPIPQMPAYFSSMANIRGEVYGILDLALFFQDIKEDNHDYLLVLNDDEYKVAIALKHVPNTLKVNESMIEELSSSTFGSLKGKKYLTGIVKQDKQMIILFDVKGMISNQSFANVSINK